MNEEIQFVDAHKAVMLKIVRSIVLAHVRYKKNSIH